MERSLSHLPNHKQEGFEEITPIVKENPGSEIVILFGSARHNDHRRRP
jgi:hypothetical protein